MRLLAFLFLIIPSLLSAQESAFSYVNENGDRLIPGIIQLKVRSDFRELCTNDAIAIPELMQLTKELNAVGLNKKFPNELPPERQYNDHGLKLADISLLYDLAVPVHTDIPKAIEQLNALGVLEYAEGKYEAFDMFNPNDMGIINVNPYHYLKVAAYDAWDVTEGDTNVVIGISDTSFDLDHEDLSGNIKYNYDDPVDGSDDDFDSYIDNFAGWDMVDNDNNLFNFNEIHGTAVAAIASASLNNGIGYGGIGFKCKFLPVKVSINASPYTVTKGYEAIQYCVSQGCSVINCSWGNTTFSQTAQDIITWAAVNNDAVIVAAAGNVTSTLFYYPASYNYALSVTGVNSNDVFNDGSNPPFVSNDSVDVSAPGYNVYTTATYNGGALYSPPQGGTSMAAPIVAGIAGLVRSQFPCMSALEVIEKIKSSSDNIDGISQNIPYAGTIGEGRVNALAAVTGSPCDPVGTAISMVDATEVMLYPNPMRDQTVLKTNRRANWELELFDASGKMIRSERFSGDGTSISDLPSGFYIARITDGSVVLSKKLTVTDH